MAIYNKRINFTKENLIDHYMRRDSLPDFIYGIVRFIGIIIQNIYCVSSYLVLSWIILFPISWIRSDLYSKAENCLYNSLLFIVSSWSMAAGITVVETGDEYKHLIEESESILSTTNDQGESLLNGYKQKTTTTTTTQSSLNNPKPTLDVTKSDKLIGSDNTTKSLLITNKTGDQLEQTGLLENDLNQSRDDNLVSGCPKTINNNDNNTNNNNNDNNFNKANLLKANKVTYEKNQLNTTGQQQQQQQSNILTTKSLSPSKTTHQRTPRVLLLCNHISTADVPLIMQSFSTLTKQSLLWVLDAQFKPTNFGLVCSSHGDFFIAKNSFTDGSLRDQVLKYPDRNLLVLFPEGGFWRKRLEGSNRYALKNNLPMTQYVTHPRFGAFKDLIDPSIEVTHIVDATLLYDDIKNPLSILDIALGSRKEPAILHYKVYKRSEINPTEEWLRNLWMEKDKLLQQYYEDRGRIYNQFEGTMRSAKLDWFKVVSVHLFYLFVCYLTIYRLFNATSVTMLKARDLYYSNI